MFICDLTCDRQTSPMTSYMSMESVSSLLSRIYTSPQAVLPSPFMTLLIISEPLQTLVRC